MCRFTNDPLIEEAYDFSDKFKNDSIYPSVMCGKETKNSVQQTTVEEKLDLLESLGTIDATGRAAMMQRFEKYRYKICALPVGHTGKCMANLTKLFPEFVRNKINDTMQAPGNDDYFYKNRCSRTFPLMLPKAEETKLREELQLKKKNTKLKAGIPLEYAATPYDCATAQFDLCSLLLYQKGVDGHPDLKLEKDVYGKMKARGKQYAEELKARSTPIAVLNSDGFLCDPLTGKTIQPEWYLKTHPETNEHVQFGHIDPLRNDRFQTRGGNVFMITRQSNLTQTDNSFLGDEMLESLLATIAHNPVILDAVKERGLL